MKKMHNWEYALMVLVAIVFDVIQILLILSYGVGLIFNSFLNILFGAIFGFWFKLRGAQMSNVRVLFGFVITFFLEEIPGLDALPWWTINIIFTWWSNNTQSGQRIMGAASKFKTINTVAQMASGKAPPLNTGARREPTGRVNPSNDSGRRAPRGGI